LFCASRVDMLLSFTHVIFSRRLNWIVAGILRGERQSSNVENT
jgi:hypothetical protein